MVAMQPLLAGIVVLLGATGLAEAQCALPFEFENGQVGNAVSVMSNFEALADCGNTGQPAGSNGAIQYKATSDTFGAMMPMTTGQTVVGRTDTSPATAPLVAGAGISITHNPGQITITAYEGLYGQVMSETPTLGGVGLSNWLNQGSSSVTDSAVGICIDVPASGSSNNVVGRYMASPSPPYTITALIAATRNSTGLNAVGLGWYDGSSKLHQLSYVIHNSGTPRRPYFAVDKWNNTSTLSGTDYTSSLNGFSQPVWLQLRDDGTNIVFAFSQDGMNFLDLFTSPKSSGFLGSSGYANIVFSVNPRDSRTLATLMSWAVE